MSLQLFFPLNTRATYCFHNYPVSCVCYISKAQGSIRALSWVWHFSSTSPFHSLSNCFTCCHLCVASQVALVVKTLPANAGDIRDSSLIPGSGRSPGGGHGNPLWYSCLENPMDRGAWRATTAAAAKSLQLCPTLCDPIDGSPPGSPVPGILDLDMSLDSDTTEAT